MKTAFLAYRASGEDMEALRLFLKFIRDELSRHGIKAYITDLEDNPTITGEPKMVAALKKIDSVDAVIAVARTGELGEGMLIEMGYSYGRKPTFLLRQEGVTTKMEQIVDVVMMWRSEQDLQMAIGRVAQRLSR